MSRAHVRFLTFVCALSAQTAFAAHYGTDPVSPAGTATVLRISNQAPMCPDRSVNCIETTGATQAYAVVDGDQITIDWTNQPNTVSGVIETRHLYLPITTANGNATPVTFELELQNLASPAVVVLYGGTRHHVPLQPNAWQGITVYNPDERVLYLRLDTSAQARP